MYKVQQVLYAYLSFIVVEELHESKIKRLLQGGIASLLPSSLDKIKITFFFELISSLTEGSLHEQHACMCEHLIVMKVSLFQWVLLLASSSETLEFLQGHAY